MSEEIFDQMSGLIARTSPTRPIGKIAQITADTAMVEGLSHAARVGDRVAVVGGAAEGEVVRASGELLYVLIAGSTEGLGLGVNVVLLPRPIFAPHDGWIGRVIDPEGQPLDGRPLLPGIAPKPVSATPPPASERRQMGARLSTGFAVFDTILPIVRGQRIGLFAGSGVGKSTLLASLAKQVEADAVSYTHLTLPTKA